MKSEADAIFRSFFEGDCGTKKKGFIDAIWKKKLLKSHMISSPLDFPMASDQIPKKGSDVGVSTWPLYLPISLPREHPSKQELYFK